FVAGFMGSPAMNLVPCGLEQAAGGLRLNLGNGASFPVPADRTDRYRSHASRGRLLFGLRPEHLFEHRQNTEPGQHAFEATPEVVEPMGMETLVMFTLGGVETCARVNPGCGAQPGAPLKLLADLRHMHLIDDESGRVL
ncbi:MAG: TOBE domain-containing protein, partial [Burkholderiales bacterium]